MKKIIIITLFLFVLTSCWEVSNVDNKNGEIVKDNIPSNSDENLSNEKKIVEKISNNNDNLKEESLLIDQQIIDDANEMDKEILEQEAILKEDMRLEKLRIDENNKSK